MSRINNPNQSTYVIYDNDTDTKYSYFTLAEINKVVEAMFKDKNILIINASTLKNETERFLKPEDYLCH